MTFLDLFAGIGGFRRGMELAGHKCVGFCEWDKFATASYTSMHLITEEQREYLATMDLKKRQKEILKEEYRNGEFYSNDIRRLDARNIPRADCWCFGAPCQDFSVAGHRAGLEGDRSSLVREVFRVLREINEEDRPEWLIYENVKGMFSSNRGFDYWAILNEMDETGYDAEWYLFNSKFHGVPQNRERVYTIGHLRTKGECKVFPIEGTDRANNIQIKQIGRLGGKNRDNPERFRVYGEDGVDPSIHTMGGGGLEPHVPVTINVGNTNPSGNGMNGNCYFSEGVSPAINCNKNDGQRVAIKVAKYPSGNEKSDIFSADGVSRTLTATDYKQPVSVVLPVLTPDREEKRQNGRRIKDNGEEMFTLTAQDRPGVGVEISPEVIGGIGEKDFGKQYRQGNRIYDANKVATALESSPVGNAGGNSNLYAVPVGFNTEEDGTSRTIKAQYQQTSGANLMKENGTWAASGAAVCIGKDEAETLPLKMSGHEVTDGDDIANCLNTTDQRKVFGANQQRTMVGEKVTIKVREAVQKGYTEALEGDSINYSHINSNTRRGRVGHQVAETLDTKCEQGVIEKIEGEPPEEHPGIYVELEDGVQVYAVWYEKYQCYIAIRKLTPKECFRLQGWTDDYFEKAQFVNSDSQLYKQAGNGVTVNVVYDIARLL